MHSRRGRTGRIIYFVTVRNYVIIEILLQNYEPLPCPAPESRQDPCHRGGDRVAELNACFVFKTRCERGR